MSSIHPNREGLKIIASFNVDASYFQQYGAQVFAYRGDSDNEEFRKSCASFNKVLTDLSHQLSEMSQLILPYQEEAEMPKKAQTVVKPVETTIRQ